MVGDVIAAIATGMTTSGIGIVRISGDRVRDILQQVFVPKSEEKNIINEKSHTIHYGFIFDGNEVVDEVLVMLMDGPHSFTGENTVEIDCHGSVFAMRRVLETVIKNGARPAEPGEFTKRAFLNGRIDLSQAEAVIDIINAKNEYSLRSSVSQLRGTILRRIEGIREQVLFQVAFIESALDDPEHISIDGYGDKLLIVLQEILHDVEGLIGSFDDGRMIREGIKTVIVGKPNVGKSSLLNVLVGDERAIVTDIAGTTRDVLEETILLQGIALQMVDTAGIRDTQDVVEKIGVERARESAKDADLILYVVDASVELDENDDNIIAMLNEWNKKAIVLLNKTDLIPVVTKEFLSEKIGLPVLFISAKEGKGIPELENLIKEMFFEGDLSFNDEVYITNIRHKNALAEAKKSLEMVQNSIKMGMEEDFYSIDLINAYESLGSITGATVGEDLVNEIFSKFCTGK